MYKAHCILLQQENVTKRLSCSSWRRNCKKGARTNIDASASNGTRLDNSTLVWYGRMVGDVVYKYMMMRVSWNGMSLLLRVWQWVPRWHLQTAGLRKILPDKAAGPRAPHNTNYGEKGKGRNEKNKFRDSVLHVVYMLL